MPTYSYRCRACSTTFELQRSMTESDARATCPEGHDDTVKLLTTVALTGAGGGATSSMDAPSGGGGCCGGGCCG